MDSHFPPFLGRGDFVPRDDLQQLQEIESIAKVMVELFNLDPDLPKMGVAPCSEGLCGVCACGGEGAH